VKRRFGTSLTRRQRRHLKHALIAAGVSILFVVVTVFLQPFSSVQWWLSDQLFLGSNPSPSVAIAVIDDESLARYGKWSDWPRDLHASAVDNLSEAGALVVGFDVLFADQSGSDDKLAESLAKAGNVVLAAAGVDPLPSSGDSITYASVIPPAPQFAEAAATIGHGNVVPDSDGVVRRIPLAIDDAHGDTYPALVVAVLHEFFASPLPESYNTEDGILNMLGRDIPVDGSRQMRVNFAGGPGAIPRLSYGDVVDGDFDPALVEGKIVLVGMSAAGEPDSWLTPISSEKMYGVEIHANAIDTILGQRFLVDGGIGTTALAVLLMAGSTGGVLVPVRLRWGFILLALLLVGYLLVAFLAFDRGYVLNILYPVLALPIVYLTVLLCRITAERSDRLMVNNLFGRYVSTQVAGTIMEMADSDHLQLGGARREVTVLFADMRGFTSLSEQVSPEDLMETLNRYLSAMTESILKNDGMVNKFAGDAIMAVWNAPQDQADHALLGARAALQSLEAVESLRNDESLPRVEFGIGVNTGPAVAGNVGSEGRTEYTVIGDAVNLAARLCGSALGGQVWIGPGTYDSMRELAEVEVLEPQRFKGKAEPVQVYRLLGLADGGQVDE